MGWLSGYVRTEEWYVMKQHLKYKKTNWKEQSPRTNYRKLHRSKKILQNFKFKHEEAIYFKISKYDFFFFFLRSIDHRISE